MEEQIKDRRPEIQPTYQHYGPVEDMSENDIRVREAQVKASRSEVKPTYQHYGSVEDMSEEQIQGLEAQIRARNHEVEPIYQHYGSVENMDEESRKALEATVAEKRKEDLPHGKYFDALAESLTITDEEQFEIMRKHESALLEEVDVYINMMDSDNCFDMSDVPADKRQLYQQYYFRPINFEIIVPKLRWITVDYPSISSAQQFGMSSESYENYFFNAVNTDYEQLKELMQPLKQILDNGKRITIQSPNVDLSLGIRGYNSEICSGVINLPDGEIFIAPELYSANGYIRFNIPTRYQGNSFQNILLRFENGKIVECSSDTNEKQLKQILDNDNGNRYIGEFAIGTNPNITMPHSNILFDEKILGSFHIALGNSHSLSDNQNRASIHWDMVHMMTEAYGGGRIMVDDTLIQENGIFVLDELKPLHSKRLIKK